MQNANFQNSMRQMRRSLPFLGWGMLVVVYIASAAAGGSFLAKLMQGSTFLAYLISAAIQATRAVIVFFPQMNPMRPTFGHVGELAAISFGCLSIYEMYGLTQGAGLSTAVFVSVAVLMVAGIIIEIMMLKEVKYSTEVELINSPESMEQINKHLQGVARIKAQLEAMREAAAQGTYVLPTVPTPPPPTAPTDPADTPTDLTEYQLRIAELEAQLQTYATAHAAPQQNGHTVPLSPGGIPVAAP